MIGLFTDVAMSTVGHARGGPAKVVVIASGIMGTINCSGIANEVTAGQFTIPLMKRFGYPAYFAGAVEATFSMGGQIMPPVMGAVAFIMAETINVPYSTTSSPPRSPRPPCCIGTIALTLASTHSIEKTRWEEDWRATPPAWCLRRTASRPPAPAWSRRPAPTSMAAGGVISRS